MKSLKYISKIYLLLDIHKLQNQNLLIRSVLKWTGIIILLMVVAFLLGPRATFKDINTTPISFDIPLNGLDAYIADKESEIMDLKPNNEAMIVWADSTKSKTEFSVVYLHGFSASREEGAPLHTDFAKRYGANLYLPRLFDHGRDTDNTFKGLLPEDLINSAKEAIAIGKLLGDKVILMTCSTGGTLGAILSPHDDAIHSLYMYSPNIDVYDSNSKIITGPWGRQLLKLAMGGEYNHINYDETAKKYWSAGYHIDGLIALKSLIEKEMTEENFAKIDIPVYVGYYYKDEENQDKVVSVDRMLDFYDQISTPSEIKRIEAFPNAGRHVMTSYVFSNDLENVIKNSYDFAEEVLGLKVKK